MIENKIEKLIGQAISELEYDDCFLVELKVNNTRVEIFLDSDTSVTFERCRKVSRKIEAVLDEKQWLGEKYTLEVSSAGVGRPLKFARQYVKNIGRTIEIKKEDGEKLKGELVQANDEKVSIKFEETIKEGKKKKKIETIVEVPMVEIKESKIKVSF
ncbi:MAG: ribosome maturation factor [Saprospiraceae bacterium]|nr:ribosome maturation factor [Saprospiraceae bacterium]